MSPDDQLPQVLQAHKGGGREEFDLAELDGELPQLRLSPELVRLHHRLVEVNIRADHGQSVGILHLGNQIERMLIHVRHVTILGSVYIAIRISMVSVKYSPGPSLPTIGRAWGISILDLSYNVLQWTVMTTTFLRVSKLKYFLCYFTKCFL